MLEFQICISTLDHFIELRARVSMYLTWIFDKNLKTNMFKTEFLIFPPENLLHTAFSIPVYETNTQLLKPQIQMLSSFCLFF